MILLHRTHRAPLVIWRDGRVVEVDPESVDFSVTIRSDAVGSLTVELRQVLQELGLADSVRID